MPLAYWKHTPIPAPHKYFFLAGHDKKKYGKKKVESTSLPWYKNS